MTEKLLVAKKSQEITKESVKIKAIRDLRFFVVVLVWHQRDSGDSLRAKHLSEKNERLILLDFRNLSLKTVVLVLHHHDIFSSLLESSSELRQL